VDPIRLSRTSDSPSITGQIMTTVVDVTNFFQHVDGDSFTMRMIPGPPPKVSCIDFVAGVTGQKKKHASNAINRMNEEDSSFFKLIEKYQFPGPGQRAKYVLCASEAIELLMMTPGKIAQAFRRHCAGLLEKLFSGDPDLHDLLDKHHQLGDATTTFCNYLQDAAPAILAAVALEEKDDAHDVCKLWIADNSERVAFATHICPSCQASVVGISLSGGVALVEEAIPFTPYRADVLVRLPDQTTVAVEVAHTHFTSGKRMFECDEAGTTTCEVETCEVQLAMQTLGSIQILRTTRTRTLECGPCKRICN
jgi:hypothetical protein